MPTVRALATALITLTFLSTAASLVAQNSPTSMTTSSPIPDRIVAVKNIGSTYVSLDSWDYPARDRVPMLEAIDTTIGVQAESFFAPSRYYFPGFYYFQVQYLSRYTGSDQFLRGGNLHDLTLKSEMRLGREWSVLLQGQFERWGFPPFFPNASANVTASAQLTWSPEWRAR